MLSVTVIAKDAAKELPRCLGSVKGVADDVVVVVDPRTSDETAEVAKKWGARVFYRQFDNFAAQKNFAVSKTWGDWILALDADEQVSPALASEIKRTLPTTDCVAFKIPRLNYIFGKAIRHTNWEPAADTHVWLWRKDAGQWVGTVHEEVIVKGKVGRMRGFKLHENYTSVEQYLVKMNDYTSREIKTANPFVDFARRYIWHLGLLDGWHGLFLSYLMAIYHLVVWVKQWEKKNISSF